MMKHLFEIESAYQGTRLDTMISTVMNLCSRNRAADLIISGDILVNSTKKKPGYKIRHKDQVCADIPDQDSGFSILPENIPLNILFEDDNIIVISKTPGMVVHPAPGNVSGTLVNALIFHYPEIIEVGADPFRPGIVHRLDKDTSGLMVIAKTKQALRFLQKEFKYRRVKKSYLALVAGQFSESAGEITLPIGRHPVKRKLMAINHESGKSAVTIWALKEQYDDACLIEALLKTGRTHQIRVHFYAIDHPLIGDKIYQPRRYRKRKSPIQRQMLHSWKLSFRHPYSGRKMFFKNEPPNDFKKAKILLSGFSI